MLNRKPPDAQDPGPGRSVGDELALRAALDPEWDAVLRVWLDGHARYPHAFVNRHGPVADPVG